MVSGSIDRTECDAEPSREAERAEMNRESHVEEYDEHSVGPYTEAEERHHGTDRAAGQGWDEEIAHAGART
jgi:hypothetical protein